MAAIGKLHSLSMNENTQCNQRECVSMKQKHVFMPVVYLALVCNWEVYRRYAWRFRFHIYASVIDCILVKTICQSNVNIRNTFDSYIVCSEPDIYY